MADGCVTGRWLGGRPCGGGGTVLHHLIPVELASQPHDQRQGGEQQQGAEQQGCLLGLQQPEQNGVDQPQQGGESHALFRAAQHMAQVEAIEGHTGQGGNEIGPGKAEMLGQRQQHQIEDGQPHAHQRVLDGVYPQPF